MSEEVTAGAESADTSQQPPAPVVEQFPEHVPIPVDVTDGALRQLREQEGFTDDDLAAIQRDWGDKTFANYTIARTYLTDNPWVDQLYAKPEFQTDDGGLTQAGAIEFGKYLFKTSGYKDPRAFVSDYSGLADIAERYGDENGNISAVGVLQAIHYVASKQGYSFRYRGKQ